MDGAFNGASEGPREESVGFCHTKSVAMCSDIEKSLGFERLSKEAASAENRGSKSYVRASIGDADFFPGASRKAGNQSMSVRQ